MYARLLEEFILFYGVFLQQVIEMEGGMVNIPLTEGKSLHIPVNRITYDPVSHQMNISEEMSKTGIWHQLNSEAQLNQPNQWFV